MPKSATSGAQNDGLPQIQERGRFREAANINSQTGIRSLVASFYPQAAPTEPPHSANRMRTVRFPNLPSWLHNPVAVRIIETAGRRRGPTWARSSALLLLCVITLGLLTGGELSRGSDRELASTSAQWIAALVRLQILSSFVLMPTFIAGAITRESDPKTWEVSLTTPTRPRSIVFGQWFGRVFLATTLLLSGLPILLSLGTFGGIPLQTVVLGTALGMATMVLVSAAAVLLAASRRGGRRVLFVFFSVLAAWLCLTEIAHSLLGFTRSNVSVLTSFSPLLSLEAMLAGTAGGKHAVTIHIMASLILTGGLLLAAVLRAGLGDSRASGRTLSRPAQEADDGNPIRWRERLRSPTGIHAWIRWWPALMAGLLGALLAVPGWQNQLNPKTLQGLMQTGVILTSVVAIIACILESASSVTVEREQGTLDLLLSTPLQPKTYLDGKARSLLEGRLPLLVAPCLFALGPALARAPLAAEVPVLLLITIPSFCIFILSVGLHQSVTNRTTVRATVVTIGLLILGLLPLNGIGGAVASLGPGAEVVRAIAPMDLIQTLADRLLEPAVPIEDTARISGAVAAISGAALWWFLSIMIRANTARGFVRNVRKLSGLR